MTQQYKVFWQHKDTLVHGKSENPINFEAAKSTVDYGNKEHPDIDHWVSVASLDFEQSQRMKLYPRTQPWLDEAM